MTFYDNGTVGLGVVKGKDVAALTTSTLNTGTHSITSAYGGDGNFLPSTSPGLTQSHRPSTRSC